MRTIRLSLVLLCTWILIACSSFDVDSDYDSSFDFSTLKQYRWYAPNEYNQSTKDFLNNDILDKRMRDNINRVLQASGFEEDMQGDADFLVNYTITSEPRVDVDTYNTYSGFAPGWGYGYYGPGPYVYGGVGMGFTNTETRVTQYQQGTLVIDIVDPISNKLVWRGTANGRIPENLSQEEKEQAVKNVVDKVLANFPPESQ